MGERARAQRVLRELRGLAEQQDALGARLELVEGRLDCVQVALLGLRNAGLFAARRAAGPEAPPGPGALRLLVQFPAQYPLVPPLFDFLQVPFHPNVRRSGELCYNLLRGDYRADLSLAGLVAGLRVLLEEPNVDDFVDGEAAAYYRAGLAGTGAGGREPEPAGTGGG